jgi:hypothetical protein
MADRVLKRPMFRRGGPINEGIMTGLVDQSVSADPTSGGLNSLVRPGYAEGDRVGFAKGEGIFNWASSDVENIKRLPSGEIDYDYYEEEDLKVPTTWGEKLLPHSISGSDFMGMPGAEYAYKFLGGEEGDVAQLYGREEEEKAEFEKERKAREKKEKKEIGIFGGAPPTKDDDAPALNQPTIVDDGTGIAKTSRADDITAIYEDLLPMLQGTLGVDKGELGRQKYLELAKFGANLMAQPGGSLTRAIGKAAADPLAGLTRIGEQQRISKRVPAELAMKIALRETEGGQLMKNARDLMKADNTLTLKDAMAKVMPDDAGGASKMIMGMAQKGGLGLQTGAAVDIYRSQIEQLLDSPSDEIRNIAGEFGTPLPEKMKDLGEEEIGNYYVKKNGRLVRWDGTKLLFIDDVGFTGKTKKGKKKKK